MARPKSTEKGYSEVFAIVPEAVLYAEDLSFAARCLYGCLRRHSNQDGKAWPSRKRMAEKLHTSIGTVDRALQELVTGGYVHRLERREGEEHFTSVYTFPALVNFGVKGVPADDEGVPICEDPPSSHTRRGVPICEDQNESHRTKAHELEGSRVTNSNSGENETDPRIQQLCELLADTMLSRPTVNRRPNITRTWLTDMDKLVRLDGRDPDDIERVIRWLDQQPDKTSVFWAPNIRSPRKLRERWDQMAEQVRSERKGRRQVDAQTAQDSLFAAADRVASVLGPDVG